MSGMQFDPAMIQQLLGGAGAGGGGEMGMGMEMGGGEAPESPSGDWLTDLINRTHQAMVSEADPATVSVLGKIIDLLTTVQAKKASGGGGS